MLAYIAEGKLFFEENGECREHTSPFIEDRIRDQASSKKMHGWKAGEDDDPSNLYNRSLIWGRHAGRPTGFHYRFRDFVLLEKEILYLIDFEQVIGIFRYNFEDDHEQRLFHTNDFRIHSFDYSEERDIFVYSVYMDDGTINLFQADGQGRITDQLTQGDSLDVYPNIMGGDVYFSSCGIGRMEDEHEHGKSPYEICRLNLEMKEMALVLSKEERDLLVPGMFDGKLVYIERPYESVGRPPMVDRIKWMVAFPLLFGIAVYNMAKSFVSFFAKDQVEVIGHGKRITRDRKVEVLERMVSMRGKEPEEMNELRRWCVMLAEESLKGGATGYFTMGDRMYVVSGKKIRTVDGDLVHKSDYFISKAEMR